MRIRYEELIKINNKKTGTSMSTIIITKKVEDKRNIDYKKHCERKSRAKICLECSSNNEGYCNKHKGWCGRVNYICLGVKNPYEYKIPKAKDIKGSGKKNKKSSGYSKKNNKEYGKLVSKYEANPNKVKNQLAKKYKLS